MRGKCIEIVTAGIIILCINCSSQSVAYSGGGAKREEFERIQSKKKMGKRGKNGKERVAKMGLIFF